MNEWLLIVVVLVAVLLFYLLLILPTQWVKIESVTTSLGLGISILQVSDLHVEMLRVSPGRLGRIIEATKPDYLFLTGDFINDDESMPRLLPYLDVLAQSHIPSFAVLGNHDYHVLHVECLVEELENRSIAVLRNRSVKLKGFWLVGIDDFFTGHSDVDKAFESTADGIKVIITHDPNVVPHITQPYHYCMAGHLHGKQFNVPGLFWLHPMGELPARGIYKGLHDGNVRDGVKGRFYISKGIGQVGYNFRLAVRSEVTLHRL